MKTAVLIIISASLGFVAAWFSDQTSDKTVNKPQPLYWVAPMDPNYRRDKPGLSPMGMDLIPVFEDKKITDSGVSINPNIQHNLGLQVADVRFDIFPQRINTTGYIQINEEKIGHVHSRVEGWVEKLYPSSAGEFITKGDPIYSVYSPLLVSAQDEFLNAISSNNTQLINLSAKRLRLLGLSQEQTNTLKKNAKVENSITIYSKYSGYISTLNIREGMYIRPETEAASIVDLSSVWLIADIFEHQSIQLKKNQPVAITIDGLPGQQWQAKIDYIYPTLNPQSRTTQVRVVLDNISMNLKPNMFARVNIDTSGIKKTLFVPRSAVIRDGHGDYVVKKINATNFQSVAVKAGASTSQHIEIIDGLTANDTVVISAQFLIDSESNIRSELSKLTPPAPRPEIDIHRKSIQKKEHHDGHLHESKQHD